MTAHASASPRRLGLGALLVSSALVIVCAAIAALVAGSSGLISVILAAGLVLAYFGSGQWVESHTLRLANANGMTITMASYALRVGLLGVILWWAMSNPTISGLLSPNWVAAGALTALVGWLSGLMIAHARSRIPIYDTPYEAPMGWDQ